MKDDDAETFVRRTLRKISDTKFFDSFVEQNKKIIERMNIDVKTLKYIKYTATGIAIISLICFVVFLDISLPVAVVFGGVLILGAGAKMLCSVLMKKMKKNRQKSYENIVELV